MFLGGSQQNDAGEDFILRDVITCIPVQILVLSNKGIDARVGQKINS